MNKFSLQAADINKSLSLMFVGAIREGLTEGFEETLRLTHQDSSNAVVHWMIGAKGDSNPASRARGVMEDLRKPRGNHPSVGRKREQRSVKNKALAAQVVRDVLAQEIKTVINQYAKGNRPSLKFFFYHPMDQDNYMENANILDAGTRGIERAVAIYEREIKLGNVRRHRLR